MRLSELAKLHSTTTSHLLSILKQNGVKLKGANSKVTREAQLLIEKFIKKPEDELLEKIALLKARKEFIQRKDNELKVQTELKSKTKLTLSDEKYPPSKFCNWVKGIEELKIQFEGRTERLAKKTSAELRQSWQQFEEAKKYEEWVHSPTNDFDSEERIMRDIQNGDGYLHGL